MIALDSPPAPLAPNTRFLVVRRDNIGDLVCTTPLIRLLRERFPEAYIAALVNAYNKSVLTGNRDLDAVYQYSKAKHVRGRQSIAGIYLERLKLIWRLRREHFDFVILANSKFQRSALNIPRFIGASHIVGYVPQADAPSIIDIPVQAGSNDADHEVMAVNRLLVPFGIEEASPPARVYPDPGRVLKMRATLNLSEADRVVGIHISARSVEGRWSAENFVSLIHRLAAREPIQMLLFWSPGDASDPRHPGDDLKAAQVLAACAGLPVRGYPTTELDELIAGLDLCETVICSDGGAMHIAAALGKSVVAIFGHDPVRWHPWKTKHLVLRTASGLASEIPVEQVADAYERLAGSRDAGVPGSA